MGSSRGPADPPAVSPGTTVRGDPLITSVQHFCLHDGPGVRSLVFFKGCPLRCAWCQNPETWEVAAELAFRVHLCIGCGRCVEVCPVRAVTAPGRRDARVCRRCFICVDGCPSGALTRYGLHYRLSALLEELRPEFPLYRDSRGGVTLSGGEATLFADFAADLVAGLKDEGVGTTLETCGLFPRTGSIQRLMDGLDLVLFDLKVFEDAEHLRHCGAGNRLIKGNLAELAGRAAGGPGGGAGPAVWPRLPLVPGFTDAEENLAAWADLLTGLGLSRLTIIPYHRLGETKREWLGREPGPLIEPPDPAAVERARRFLRSHGLETYAPGEEDWPPLRAGPRRSQEEGG